MNTNGALWLSLAVAGILVVATLDNETSPEVKKAEDKPIEEPKKVVL
ncbi:MAG: hypothetical protein ABIQ27_01085 [Flavobacterium sp.]